MSDIKRSIRIPDDLRQVSDHAVVRYLERFQGYDFNPVRAEILSPVVRAAIAQGITLLRHNGIEYKISYTPTQAVITTIVVPDDMILIVRSRNEARRETAKANRRNR
jgi:hypothetical protein